MSFASNSITAKVRAIYGGTLTAEDYSQLCAKGSVAEAAAFLKQHPRYAGVLAGINPQTVHRGQLEALIASNIFSIFERFRRFDLSDSRAFFRYIIMELEAEQLLRAIEGVAAGSTMGYISELPAFLMEHSQLRLSELGAAESFLDIAQLLDGTKFARTLRSLLIDAAESGRIDILECERRIYTQYYMEALRTAEKLYKGKQLNELKHALLKSVDMINVVTCCRMKAFNTPADKVKESLLNLRYRLREETVQRLLQLDSTEKIAAELEKMGYRTDSHAQLDTVEELTERISMDFLRRTIRMSQNSAAVYYSLIECLRIEQKNIKTAIEGIRYGLPAGEILSMLVI